MTEFNPIDWITTKEASVITGYTQENITKAIRQGRLQGLRRGRMWFVIKRDVITYKTQMENLGSLKHGLRKD